MNLSHADQKLQVLKGTKYRKIMAVMRHFEKWPLWKFPKLSGRIYLLKFFQI